MSKVLHPISHYGDVFDGRRHSFEKGVDFGVPWQEVVAWVPRYPQPEDIDPLESPDMNWTSNALLEGVQNHWSSSEGWSTLAGMMSLLGAKLGGRVDLVQRNRYSEDKPGYDPVWQSHEFKFIADDGWQGGEPL